jgi:retron-type reverse transcriptase
MHGFNNNKATVTLFLDIEWAFDKVRTTGIIAKLIKAIIPPQFIHLIHNYLQNRAFFVMHKNSYSSLRPIQAGVPQGSLLGPTLFNININDIRSVQNDSNVAISVYADDTNISVRSGSVDIAVGKLNYAIAILEPWLQKWRIKVNTQKCTLILFSRRFCHHRGGATPVKIFNETIAWTTESKYLGVTIDES